MPGTLIRDASGVGAAANLFAGATLNAAGTTNGTVQEVNKPGDVRVTLLTGTVTGTTPTLDVELKGADDLAFTVNVVSLGRLSQLAGTGAAQSNQSRYLQANVYKRYVRATVVVAGTTPVYTGSTLTLEQEDFRRIAATDSA